MSTTLSATTSSSAAANIVVPETPTAKRCHLSHQRLFFPVSPTPKLRISLSKPLSSRVVVKAQLDKAAVEGSNNAPAKPELPVQETKIDEGSSTGLASEESISEFISQVADLVKLVDSRDIMELKLKQLDCEILIRKKEAVAPAQSPAPYGMMQPYPPMTPPASSAPPPPSPVRALPAPAAAAPAAKPAKSSVPPVLSPMAGTFYRCPGPGEPPFVKVGDKVQKGQVLCIIEAMKLMNEIQAEQAGTIVEIIAEDGKPVSRDSPLFAIQP
ncbi:hypothetical protein vseg_016932 [Gypsophila vaccaria]